MQNKHARVYKIADGSFTKKELEEATKKAIESNSVEEATAHLASAFSLSSKEASYLKKAYSELLARFEESKELLCNKEQQLTRLSSYLSTILQQIQEGILFIDCEGIITLCNASALSLLDKDSSLLMTHYSKHFSQHFFGFSIEQALKIKKPQSIYHIKLPQGHKEKEIEVSCSFLNKGTLEEQGLFLLFRDVTDLRQLQKEALRRERLQELGEMAASVAHEIRNPLGGIRGYASLMIRDLQDQPHLAKMMQHILEGTKSLERLVNNVLHYTRPLELSKEKVDLCMLCKEVIQHIQVDPSLGNDIHIESHFAYTPLFIPIDRNYIKSALLNLFLNAMQASKKGGKIRLDLSIKQEAALLVLSDEGEGIHPSDIDKIFSPFFTTKQEGSGLGLSEAYKIIQAHMGKIEVRSNIGRGSQFLITLPLEREV